MSFAGPEPVSTNPLRLLASDLVQEWRADVPFPPGETSPSMRRTRDFAANPLPLLLDAYERHGPIFTLRIFHNRVVFMLGPAANHYMTVSHAENFSWREGHMGDLIPLLGDGLLTIDGDFHRRSRQIMLPAFHRERLATAVETIVAETDRALDRLGEGELVDVYAWTRGLAMRIAMRALFGLDPDASAPRIDAAATFERALSFYSRGYELQILRGPRTPFARLQQARRQLDVLIHAEIAHRRSSGRRGEDILSLLLDADDDGDGLTDAQIRDEVMTLLFAGHDTTTSTVSFMVYELARHPEVATRLRDQTAAVLADAPLTAEQLFSGRLSELDQALDETLRLYPPAWVGPRRSVRAFEFAGHTVPAGVPVNYSSWASHHLPDVFDDPHEFRPQRFAPESRQKLPKGAYIPFGGGSRTCIGMRFGQLEVRVIVARLLARFAVELAPGYELHTRQMPTIGPREGMPVILRAPDRFPAGAVVQAA